MTLRSNFFPLAYIIAFLSHNIYNANLPEKKYNTLYPTIEKILAKKENFPAESKDVQWPFLEISTNLIQLTFWMKILIWKTCILAYLNWWMC